jgi:hypothetical protein
LLGFSLNCHTIVTIQSQATKKNPREWQDYFLLFGNIFEKPANHAPIALRNTPAEIKAISHIRCDAARDNGIAISTDS